MAQLHFLLASLILTISTQSLPSLSATFTITNNCAYTVWPGILSSAGTAALPTTGFTLNPRETRTLDVPSAWSGRLWGRTLCTTDPTTNSFSCGTGDCGSSKLECLGGGAAPPATLAEFTLSGDGGNDFYDVSLVDGYNLPMVVVPRGDCAATGCLAELNRACPESLKVVVSHESVACRSACEAFGSPQYCCSGDYGNPSSCKPSQYSEFFKNACPRAYSYAYDDKTSTFTCSAGGGYSITFCPSSSTRLLAGVGRYSSSSFMGVMSKRSAVTLSPWTSTMRVNTWSAPNIHRHPSSSRCTMYWSYAPRMNQEGEHLTHPQDPHYCHCPRN